MNRWIEFLNIKPEEYAVTNLIKCCTPNESHLNGDEARNCYPYLREQLTFLQPVYIIPLGSKPAQFLLDTKIGITTLGGRMFEPLVEGPFYIPLPHPSYFLRKGGNDWEVFLEAAKELLDESKSRMSFPSDIRIS